MINPYYYLGGQAIIMVIVGIIIKFVYDQILKTTNNYLNEKAKNLATKQDIKEITKITEGIKTEMNILSQNRVSIYNEKRNAIISFLEFVEAADHFFRFEISDFILNKTKTEPFFQLYVGRFRPMEYNVRSRIKLFINDKNIDKLVNEIFQNHKDVINSLQELDINQPDGLKRLDLAKPDNLKKYQEILQKSIDIRDTLIGEFQKVLNIDN